MSEEKVRCTSCGRSFGHRYLGPSARCMYCGGKLAGPGLEHLELVEPGDQAKEQPGPAAPAKPFEVLKGRGPSRWDEPVGWLHELAVLAILLMTAGLTFALLHRHDPLLPPTAVRLAVLGALPVLWAGGVCLRVGLELLGAPARSVIVAVPLLVVGLAAGLPSALARALARLQRQVFGVWGLAVVLIAFLGGTAWLADRHDPLRGAAAWLGANHQSDKLDERFTLATTGWTGRLEGEGEGAFSMRIDSVEGDRFTGAISWVRSGRVDTVTGVYRDNQLVFPYPGPPGVERWWLRDGMLSTMELWVVGERQLHGRDLLFGHSASGQREWMRQPQVAEASERAAVRVQAEDAPALEPPVLLRPLIEVGDDRITAGRAFVLDTPSGTPVLITAASLFGPAGGLSAPINPQMLPALVGEAMFFDLLDGAMRAQAQLLRPPTGARALLAGDGGPPDASRDMIALALLPGHSLQPLQLRSEPVAPGQSIWLPTAPADPQEDQEALLGGQVLASWEHGFSVRFAAKAPVAQSIGAPLLDGSGQVAGMVVGLGDGSGTLAIVMPATWIAARLER